MNKIYFNKKITCFLKSFIYPGPFGPLGTLKGLFSDFKKSKSWKKNDTSYILFLSLLEQTINLKEGKHWINIVKNLWQYNLWDNI